MTPMCEGSWEMQSVMGSHEPTEKSEGKLLKKKGEVDIGRWLEVCHNVYNHLQEKMNTEVKDLKAISL